MGHERQEQMDMKGGEVVSDGVLLANSIGWSVDDLWEICLVVVVGEGEIN